MPDSIKVKCPATSANLGAGFDVCGIALQAPFDVMHARVVESRASCSVKSSPQGKYNVPEKWEQNTCCPPVQKMLEEHGTRRGVEFVIEKNVKPASGLGSSAATAAGAAFAVNELFSLGLSKEELVKYASLGEIVSAGSPHLDNVAPAIFGGFTVTLGANPVKVSRFSPPSELECLLLLPSKEKASTKAAREVLPKSVSREDLNYNLSKLATLVSGFAKKDCKQIAQGLGDKITEPAREQAGFLVGLREVKEVAEKHGFGACASGAGPTLLCLGAADAAGKKFLEQEAKEVFPRLGLGVQSWWTKPSEQGVCLL